MNVASELTKEYEEIKEQIIKTEKEAKGLKQVGENS